MKKIKGRDIDALKMALGVVLFHPRFKLSYYLLGYSAAISDLLKENNIDLTKNVEAWVQRLYQWLLDGLPNSATIEPLLDDIRNRISEHPNFLGLDSMPNIKGLEALLEKYEI